MSVTWFWMGVPVRITRCSLRKLVTAANNFVLGFWIAWPCKHTYYTQKSVTRGYRKEAEGGRVQSRETTSHTLRSHLVEHNKRPIHGAEHGTGLPDSAIRSNHDVSGGRRQCTRTGVQDRFEGYARIQGAQPCALLFPVVQKA